MGAKTQLENKKLDVPAPGAYNIPDKVSVSLDIKQGIGGGKPRQEHG